MKAFCILSLILLSNLIPQQHGKNNDVIQYGFNYTGGFKDGERHGFGKFIYPNGDTYDGEWVNDNREGEGVFTFNNDSNTYVGGFLNNLFHTFC